MSADLTEFHAELRGVARAVLARRPPGEGAPGPDGLSWERLAETGWLGLEVPEALGGAGATLAEAAVVLHEMGRAPQSCAYLGGAVLGAGLLALLEPHAGRDELFAGLASGAIRPAVGLATGEGAPLGAAPFALERRGGHGVVHGEAGFVPDAVGADRLLLLARDGRSTVVVATSPGAAGLQVAPQPVVDETRSLGRITAAGVEVDAADLWPLAADPAGLVDRGALAVACDSLGLAEAMLEATVAYAGVRHQFDRPIGSFQAVQHACADMLVQVAVGRELVAAAVAGLAAGEPDAARTVSMAKAHVGAAAVDVVGKAMQLHGGIGYTWESGVHVYLKRAILNRSLFGSPGAHRRRVARRYLGERGAAPE